MQYLIVKIHVHLQATVTVCAFLISTSFFLTSSSLNHSTCMLVLFTVNLCHSTSSLSTIEATHITDLK